MLSFGLICKVFTVSFINLFPGCCTRGTYVDFKYRGIYGVPVADDTMEGKSFKYQSIW